jgi:LysR family hydrogen peroxide-inducible transcriptional activator
MTELGLIARRLDIPEAHRTVRLVHRRAFPRVKALEALAQVIVDELPDTVQPVREIMADKPVRGHRGMRSAR